VHDVITNGKLVALHAEQFINPTTGKTVTLH
jgi:hypothetical protein